MIGTQDDMRHALSGAMGRESLWFNVSLQEEGLMVLAYTWVGVDDRAGSIFAVVHEGDDVLAHESASDVDAAGMDFDGWKVGGLTVRNGDPLRTVELGFDGDGVRCQLTYEAMHPAYAYGDHPRGCPQYVADDRFEQSCRVTGRLVLGDREIAVDTFGHRDHSWGTRDWNAYHHWQWLNAQTDQVQVNLFHCLAHGEVLVNGYVARPDGIAHVVGIEDLIMRHDDDWSHRDVAMTIRTDDGRTLAFDSHRYARFTFPAGESILLNEIACRGTLDGEEATVHVEMGWDRVYSERQSRRMRKTRHEADGAFHVA